MKNTTGILSILFVLIGFAILGLPTKTEAGFSWYVGIGIGGGNGYYGSPYGSYSPYYNGYGSYGGYYNPYGYNDDYGYYYKPVYADYSSRGVYNNPYNYSGSYYNASNYGNLNTVNNYANSEPYYSSGPSLPMTNCYRYCY